MSNRSYFLLILVHTHLGIVICGAAGLLPHPNRGTAARVLSGYGALTGADSGYGFFAPVVGAPHRARFILNDTLGNTWQDTLEGNSSGEARLRLTGIIDRAFMTGIAREEPGWRQRLLQSWGATMFSRHPSADSLRIVVEASDIPSMAEYLAGSPCCWEVVFQAELQRESATERR